MRLRAILIGFLAVFAIAAESSASPSRCTVRGSMTGLQEGQIVKVWDNWAGRAIDSVKVHAGRFEMTFSLEGATSASIRGAGTNRLFVAEPGVIQFSGDARDLLKGAEGTELNERLSRFLPYYSSLYEKERPAYVRRVVRYNRDNILSVMALEHASCLSSEEVVKLIDNEIVDEIKMLPYVVNYRWRRSQQVSVEPRSRGSERRPYYYDIVSHDAAGNEVSLSYVVNAPSTRYVLVDFWATWCAPCRKEIPYLVAAYRKYHSRGLEIFSVSWDYPEDADKWKRFVQDKLMTWVNVCDFNGGKSKSTSDYKVDGIPTNVLIDCSTGFIVARNLMGDELEAKLSMLMFR